MALGALAWKETSRLSVSWWWLSIPVGNDQTKAESMCFDNRLVHSPSSPATKIRLQHNDRAREYQRQRLLILFTLTPSRDKPPPPSHQSTQNFPLCLMVPVGPSKISPVKQLFGHNFSAAGPSLPWRMLGSYDRLRESRRWSLSLYSGRDHTGLGSSHLARWQWSLHWEACHRCHMLLCSHQFWLIQYQLGGRAQVFTSCSFVN